MSDEEIRKRALYLQSVGPDEFPYSFYEHLARTEGADE